MTFNSNDYKPTSVNDIIFGNDDSKRAIDNIVSGRKAFPPMSRCKNGILLYGLWGTGKTTLAKLLPEAIEHAKTREPADQTHFEFINCQMGYTTGIQITTSIDTSANLVSANPSGYHYFVFDELDNLTDAAQTSLKSVMDKQSTIFIFTTNHFDKIDPGIVNRCVTVEMNAAPASAWLNFSKRVLSDAGINNVSNQDLLDVLSLCKGSVRNIMDELQTIIADTQF